MPEKSHSSPLSDRITLPRLGFSVTMKSFPIGFLVLLIALVAAVSAWLVSIRSSQLLHSEIAGLHERTEHAESMVDHQRQWLADARLGSTLLYRMALSDEYGEVFDFLRAIPAASLSCRTMEFPEYPPVKLVSFHHHRQSPDGSVLFTSWHRPSRDRQTSTHDLSPFLLNADRS